MSGIVQNNILRSSGTIAVSAAGLNWVDTIITGSTATVEAGNGYWINTTSNTCTITLPSSAEKGDQIVIIDYARTWGTNKIIIDSNGLNYQGNPDNYTVEYTTDGQSVNIVYSDATKGWIPLEDDVTALEPSPPATQKGLFAFGSGSSGRFTGRNLVSSSGVIASDVSGAGTGRSTLAGTTYGGDKGIFGFGNITSPPYTNITNLVNNSGVIASDTTGVGTARQGLAAAQYGGIAAGTAIFAFGYTGSATTGISNLVSSSGVVATDTSAVGTGRNYLGGANYGGDKAIFGYGRLNSGSVTGITNLVNSSGVVGSDVSAVGTARKELAAASYGGDKALFVGGRNSGSTAVSLKNLVNSSGVVAADVTGVGNATRSYGATMYGGDKAIFAYGIDGSDNYVNKSNLVNNLGVMAADVTGVGTAREWSPALGYSSSA